MVIVLGDGIGRWRRWVFCAVHFLTVAARLRRDVLVGGGPDTRHGYENQRSAPRTHLPCVIGGGALTVVRGAVG